MVMRPESCQAMSEHSCGIANWWKRRQGNVAPCSGGCAKAIAQTLGGPNGAVARKSQAKRSLHAVRLRKLGESRRRIGMRTSERTRAIVLDTQSDWALRRTWLWEANAIDVSHWLQLQTRKCSPQKQSRPPTVAAARQSEGLDAVRERHPTRSVIDD